jgi:hypothetical protein
VRATDDWELELASSDKPNLDRLVSGDAPAAMRGRTPNQQDEMRRELWRSLIGNRRHKRVRIPERDGNRFHRNAIRRLNVGTIAQVSVDHVAEYYEGDGYGEEARAKARAQLWCNKHFRGALPVKADRT